MIKVGTKFKLSYEEDDDTVYELTYLTDGAYGVTWEGNDQGVEYYIGQVEQYFEKGIWVKYDISTDSSRQ